MEEEGKGVGEYEDRGEGVGGRRMEKGNGEKGTKVRRDIIAEKGVQRQETESAGESQRRKGMIEAEEGEEDREHRGGGEKEREK